MTIKIGDIIRNNDPRSKGRQLYVRKIQDGYVHAAMEPMGIRLTRIREDRIHEDGRPRRTGYSVVLHENSIRDALNPK